MTEGDWYDLFRKILVIGPGVFLWYWMHPLFTPWRYFGTLALMLGDQVFGRMMIALDPESAWMACIVYQTGAAIILFIVAETWVGLVIGALFGVSVIGGGLTAMGILSPLPSIGLTYNYWSVMSVVSYLQDVILLAYAGVMAGRKWAIGSRDF